MPLLQTLAQDYSKLVESGGPVLIAFAVLATTGILFGTRIVIPALIIWRQITTDTAVITQTLKDTIPALTDATEKASAAAQRNADSAARLEIISERLASPPRPNHTTASSPR